MIKQEEYLGLGSIDNLKKIVKVLSAKKVIIVSGNNSYIKSGISKYVNEATSDCEILYFTDYKNNTDINDVRRGIKIYNEFCPDLVVAVGGGSSIDMAKLINIFSVNNSKDIDYYLHGKVSISHCPVPLVAIPTTAGTGSEATHFAVLYVGKDKYSVAHDFILPNFSIVDPQLTYAVPKDVIASTAIDALSQAVESYWCVNSTDESKIYSTRAITLIMPVLNSLLVNNREYNAIMCEASNYAGKAINITKTTAPHALSYPFTSHYGIKHGHAVGLTMGLFLEANYYFNETQVQDERGAAYVKATMEELYMMFGCAGPKESRDMWYEMLNAIGLEIDFSKLGIGQKQIEVVIDNINIERMSNHPVRFSKSKISSLLNSCV